MMQMRETAPAKINLALDILGRREDGYHELRTVMQSISLCDTVTVEEVDAAFALWTDGEPFSLPAGKQSMEQRAAEAFFAAIGMAAPPLCVRLQKVTPAYAGLGGGSADVAALLRCLARRYAPALPAAELERIGLQVGSDVPFCVAGGTALAEGRGERLRALPPLPECWMVLCKPAFGIPTPSLFARVDTAPPVHRPDIAGMVRALEEGSLAGVAERLCNVFEEYLPPECGAVLEIKRRLVQLGAMNAAMSGSGSAVFGIFQSQFQAAAAASALKADYPRDLSCEARGANGINRNFRPCFPYPRRRRRGKGRKFFYVETKSLTSH